MLVVLPTLTAADVRARLNAAAATIAWSSSALPDGLDDALLARADTLARDLADYARRAEVLAAQAAGAPHHDIPAARCGDGHDGGVVRRLGPAPAQEEV